ncbi:MAG TPA: ABC transporter permease [Thermomicrobiaceae bacterium]|nr:ABC transporter permease [Thermomicrobiaceae bacterium]
MNRGQYILRRLVQMIPVLFGITVIVFMMVHLIPGNPAAVMLGDRATDKMITEATHRLGLDKPLWEQYGYFMRNLVQLNLGESIKYGVPVSSLLWHRLLVSMSVAVMTILLTTIISLPLGILSALKKDSILDNVVRSSLMVTMVMPSFWVGIMLIILLSIRIHLFPVAGWGTGFGQHVWHIFLPSLTIGLGVAPILIRTLRNSILESLGTDYIKTARSKGLRESSVIVAHVLRNALIPAVTLLGITMGGLMGGTVIMEKVFALPGAGALLIDSVSARDYPVVQSATLVFALLVILVNLVTDIIYSFIDPRVRFG